MPREIMRENSGRVIPAAISVCQVTNAQIDEPLQREGIMQACMC